MHSIVPILRNDSPSTIEVTWRRFSGQQSMAGLWGLEFTMDVNSTERSGADEKVQGFDGGIWDSYLLAHQHIGRDDISMLCLTATFFIVHGGVFFRRWRGKWPIWLRNLQRTAANVWAGCLVLMKDVYNFLRSFARILRPNIPRCCQNTATFLTMLILCCWPMGGLIIWLCRKGDVAIPHACSSPTSESEWSHQRASSWCWRNDEG